MDVGSCTTVSAYWRLAFDTVLVLPLYPFTPPHISIVTRPCREMVLQQKKNKMWNKADPVKNPQLHFSLAKGYSG